MLDPNNRSLLSEQLQPPRGFELVQAVGTTFTLDLSTALSVPLSFASRGFADNDDLGILAALSQYADRITVFTQAGAISPVVRSNLVALLEKVVQPVHPPRGIFHPKVWLLEYAAGEDRAYRLLCNSRNLTEDRSWDLSVRLDGTLAAESNRDSCQQTNAPLVAFLEHLPELTVNPLPQVRKRNISEFAQRIANVQWEMPTGVSEARFHFLNGPQLASDTGKTSAQVMFDVLAKDALAISPFLSPEGLHLITALTSEKPTVLSRIESLERLPKATLGQLGDTYVLHDALEDAGSIDDTQPELSGSLAGLHAKAVFLSERKNYSLARAYIGSANLTAGGLHNNIEMMVELRGHKDTLGPSVIRKSLGSMLEPHSSSGSFEADESAEAQRRLEARVRALAAGSIKARVSGVGPYSLHVWHDGAKPEALGRMQAEGIAVQWRPVSLTSGGVPLGFGESGSTEISELRLTQVTPFLLLTASTNLPEGPVSVRTVVLAELADDIDGRQDAILAQGIADGDEFLRLLALLLDPDQQQFGPAKAQGEEAGSWSATMPSSGLFEALLRSLAQDDDGLDIAQRVLAQLRANAGEHLNLPEGFEELWDNVWQARSARSVQIAEEEKQ